MKSKRFAALSTVATLAFSGLARAADTSEVPLPGALWLLGAALLVFVGISARRKF